MYARVLHLSGATLVIVKELKEGIVNELEEDTIDELEEDELEQDIEEMIVL